MSYAEDNGFEDHDMLALQDERTRYTVGVGSWTYMDGTPAPERTCGHAHKTVEAAEKCGTKLYAAKTVNGNWQACAAWHNWYVTEVGR